MILRVKKMYNDYCGGYQPCRYKVQKRILGIFWSDCESGVDGHMYIPDFVTKEQAIEFGVFYAKREGKEVT